MRGSSECAVVVGISVGAAVQVGARGQWCGVGARGAVVYKGQA